MNLIRRLILAFALIAGVAPAIAQSPTQVPPLPDSERRTSYSISGTTCACALNFMLLGDGTDYQNWVEVYLNGTRVNYNDATFGWTITSPSGSLGSIARPVTDAKLTFNSVQTGTVQIVGARRPRRLTQFSESAGVPARDFNQALTDIISQNREIWDKTNDMTGRGIFAPPGETLNILAAASARASTVLGFDALGQVSLYSPSSAVTSAANVNFLQSGTGAISRTVQDKERDIISVKDFGASPSASAAANTTAFGTAASNAVPFFVPAGTFATNTAAASFVGRWWGPGVVTDASSNQRGYWYSNLTSAPSYTGPESSIDTAFNGDFSRSHIASESRITGTATLGQPVSGYSYTPSAVPFYHYLYNSSGWNQSTSDNTGRTAAVAYRTKVFQNGQGDAVAYNASVFVTGTRSGSTNFLANPAGGIIGGDLQAGAAGVYLNPGEWILHDGGFDVAGIGWVVNLDRNVNTGAKGAWWGGYRAQSSGSAAANSAFSALGNFDAGLDLSTLATTTNKVGIALKADDRIYGNTSSSNSSYATTLNSDYFTYSSGLTAWNFVVANSSVFQIYNAQIAAIVPFQMTEVSTPSNPPSGSIKTYAKSGDRVYQLTPGGTESPFVLPASTDTFTNKTFDTAGAGNSFSINGLAATANTGTGSVVRATSPTITTPTINSPTIDSATLSTKLNKGIYILGQSGAAASVTGTLSTTTLATIAVPANVMGTNGSLRITTMWSYTNSANNKTLTVSYGGSNYANFAVTTSASTRDQRQITNRNATNSQVGWNAGSQGGGWTTTAGAVATSAVDTTTSQNILIQGTLANSGETITLESYTVELILP